MFSLAAIHGVGGGGGHVPLCGGRVHVSQYVWYVPIHLGGGHVPTVRHHQLGVEGQGSCAHT